PGSTRPCTLRRTPPRRRQRRAQTAPAGVPRGRWARPPKEDSQVHRTASAWVEQHRERVGFALQVFPNDTPTDKARHLLAAGRLAEALGFDAFFVGDHPAWALEPWLHLGALAVTTERIRLGLNVACALFRHPVMTARLAADLDNLSGGRLVLGLGCGWDENEFGNLGLPFPPVRERQAALEEAVAIVRGVWGDEPFTFPGRYFRS